MQNKSILIALAIIAAPIVYALGAFPDTFSLGWNQGRGGFLFAMAFIAAELIGVKLQVSRRKLFAIIPLAAAVMIYLTSLPLGLRSYLVVQAPNYHVNLVDSWAWMWDF